MWCQYSLLHFQSIYAFPKQIIQTKRQHNLINVIAIYRWKEANEQYRNSKVKFVGELSVIHKILFTRAHGARREQIVQFFCELFLINVKCTLSYFNVMTIFLWKSIHKTTFLKRKFVGYLDYWKSFDCLKRISMSSTVLDNFCLIYIKSILPVWGTTSIVSFLRVKSLEDFFSNPTNHTAIWPTTLKTGSEQFQARLHVRFFCTWECSGRLDENRFPH